ncbi:MAG TPA: MFS transporter [Sphaerochaeta sp.]|jgi:MFS family permease|nr:MFS transporter [Spirochaetota bacterium]HOE84429.1 MFS transporter [Sphaerochaeta sp.]HPK47468.1 MFS transporter [Sphaerochaeta sp.]
MKAPLSIYRGLPRPIYTLFLSTVINSVGVFVYPFLTLYLTQRLGYPPAKAGLFLTVASILYVPGSLLGSTLADSIGRKWVAVPCEILMNSCYLAAGFLEGTEWVPLLVLAALFFDGMVDPAREAMKTDVTSIENRQASFSLIYLGHNLGFAIGPVIAGLFFYRSPSWLFFGNAIAGFLSVLLIIFQIEETKPSKETIEESRRWKSGERAEEGGALKALFSRPRLLAFSLSVTCFSYAYSQTLFALPLLTTALFGPGGAPLYGRMMALNGVVVVLLTPLIVMVGRRLTPLSNITISGLLYTIGFSLFAFATTEPVFLLLVSVYTIGEIVNATNQGYWIANNTPISHRGRFSAILPIIMGTGHAIAPVIGGAIIQYTDLSVLWLTTGLAALAGTVGIAILRRLTGGR